MRRRSFCFHVSDEQDRIYRTIRTRVSAGATDSDITIDFLPQNVTLAKFVGTPDIPCVAASWDDAFSIDITDYLATGGSPEYEKTVARIVLDVTLFIGNLSDFITTDDQSLIVSVSWNRKVAECDNSVGEHVDLSFILVGNVSVSKIDMAAYDDEE